MIRKHSQDMRTVAGDGEGVSAHGGSWKLLVRQFYLGTMSWDHHWLSVEP